MLTCSTCAGCTISDCLNTEAVATGEAQLTLQNSKFVNNFNEGFTDGGALAVEKATSALLTNITFTGTSGFDVIARDPEASIYTDTLNAFEINPSGEGEGAASGARTCARAIAQRGRRQFPESTAGALYFAPTPRRHHVLLMACVYVS